MRLTPDDARAVTEEYGQEEVAKDGFVTGLNQVRRFIVDAERDGMPTKVILASILSRVLLPKAEDNQHLGFDTDLYFWKGQHHAAHMYAEQIIKESFDAGEPTVGGFRWG